MEERPVRDGVPAGATTLGRRAPAGPTAPTVLIGSSGRRLLVESLARALGGPGPICPLGDPIHDPAALVRAARATRPDLLVLDVDGGSPSRTMSLVERLKRAAPKTRVLLLLGTRTDRELLLLDYVRAGADGFLDRSSGLADVVDELCEAAVGRVLVIDQDVVRVLRRAAEDREATRRTSSLLRALTDRELEVLRLIAEGLGNDDIGARLRISSRTVATHAQNVYRKIDAHSRAEAVAIANRTGLFGDDDPTRPG